MMQRISPLLLRLAAFVGLDRELLLQAACVSPEALLRPEGLLYDEAVRLGEAVASLSRDPYIGLTAGERLRLDALGMLGPAFATAHDLADGLRVMRRTLPLVVREGDLRVSRDSTGGGMLYRMPVLDMRHGVDLMFAGVLTLVRRCTGITVRPRTVAFQMPPPPDVARYTEVFGREPIFSAPRCLLWFSVEDLSRPFLGADSATSELLRSHADALLGEPPVPEEIVRAEAALLRSLDRSDGTLEGTASLLGVHPRTLQRQLRERGTSFKSLRDRLFQKEAERGLTKGETVESVATRLGYANRSSFERAFLRWTGATPKQYREAASDR